MAYNAISGDTASGGTSPIQDPSQLTNLETNLKTGKGSEGISDTLSTASGEVGGKMKFDPSSPDLPLPNQGGKAGGEAKAAPNPYLNHVNTMAGLLTLLGEINFELEKIRKQDVSAKIGTDFATVDMLVDATFARVNSKIQDAKAQFAQAFGDFAKAGIGVAETIGTATASAEADAQYTAEMGELDKKIDAEQRKVAQAELDKIGTSMTSNEEAIAKPDADANLDNNQKIDKWLKDNEKSPLLKDNKKITKLTERKANFSKKKLTVRNQYEQQIQQKHQMIMGVAKEGTNATVGAVGASYKLGGAEFDQEAGMMDAYSDVQRKLSQVQEKAADAEKDLRQTLLRTVSETRKDITWQG